jgi:prepilin-type N-terminal cleavage/methylation domain-containing protein
MLCFAAAEPKSMNRVNRSAPKRPPSLREGLTLVELLVTLAVIAILAAVIIPHMGTQIPEQIEAAAEIVAADLEYARSLAVANGSNYRLTFEPDAEQYYLQHSGSNTLLAVLPASPFRQNDDPPDRQTTRLTDLPLAQPVVRLEAVVAGSGTPASVTDIEFTALGNTTRTDATVLWLGCGAAGDERFISIQVNPATGLVELGPVLTELPSAVASLLE